MACIRWFLETYAKEGGIDFRSKCAGRVFHHPDRSPGQGGTGQGIGFVRRPGHRRVMGATPVGGRADRRRNDGWGIAGIDGIDRANERGAQRAHFTS